MFEWPFETTIKEVIPESRSVKDSRQKLLPYIFQIMTNVLIPPIVQRMRNVSTLEVPTPACVMLVSMEMEKIAKVRLNINTLKLNKMDLLQ